MSFVRPMMLKQACSTNGQRGPSHVEEAIKNMKPNKLTELLTQEEKDLWQVKKKEKVYQLGEEDQKEENEKKSDQQKETVLGRK
ncbi:hypothetical protein L596_030945 [Steinernema carpocapsae]|uniref:Uncharacterized protein n=1 Tax=Steinernema carpocapsae TaxID=34508 RepID=A0A4U5MHF9_STECR|nr:hypothetical protein L596_030945 [Steinernema carpocapsae]